MKSSTAAVVLMALASLEAVYGIVRHYSFTNTRGPIGSVQSATRVLVNGQSPGPAIVANVGDVVQVTVTNKINTGEVTTIHWHGIQQRGTPYNDGVIGVTQCPIATNQSMVYRFIVDQPGTYWYHGHVNQQYIDGLYGPLIVNRPNEQQFWAAQGAPYKHDDWTFSFVDYYQNTGNSYVPWYFSPASGGNEPLPERFLVNGQSTSNLKVYARNDLVNNAYRVRVINGASFSMFNLSIDGLGMKLLEIDGMSVQPVTVNWIVLNAAARVSFLLDFTTVAAALKTSPSLWMRFNGMPMMFPSYNATDPHLGLYSTATGLPVELEWKGLIVFDNTGSYTAAEEALEVGGVVPIPMPTYNHPPALPFVSPKDTNFLDARPMQYSGQAPEPTHSLYYEIVIRPLDATPGNTGKALVNGVTYSIPPGNAPLLYDFLQASSVRLKTLVSGAAVNPIGAALASANNLIPIYGDGATPFVLPYNAVIDMFINNTDGGEHPIHTHGHSFWVISSSEYPQAEALYKHNYMLRDIASVPANGWIKIRFVADNPGVWSFHCHIDWHMAIGLYANVIEAPDVLQRTSGFFYLDPTHAQACATATSFPFVRHLSEQTSENRNPLRQGLSLKETAELVGQAYAQK
jgi:iron transport multicopper oxidase